MSFVLETSKNGKDCILYHNHKYRESYPLKSGDIVWRCLGKICKATIKTNQEKNAIFFSSEIHTGKHPVTMRALTPTPSPHKRFPPTSTPGSESFTSILKSTPVISQSAGMKEMDINSHPETSLSTSPPHSLAVTSVSESLASTGGTATLSQPASNDVHATSSLLLENISLKKELAELRAELNVILDHSIESDQRLLEYTENVFLPPKSKSEKSENISELTNELLSMGKAVQAYGDKHEHGEVKGISINNSAGSRPCQSCIILKEETNNMIESIRCLEAEIARLSNVNNISLLTQPINPKSAPLPVLRNSFDALSERNCSDTAEEHEFITVQNNRRKRKSTLKGQSSFTKTIFNRKLNKVHTKTLNVNIPFKNVTVIGDSHIRNLASLISDKVSTGTVVSGVCKPGAGILNMEPVSRPPSVHCYVIMAGANDVDKGREDLIYNHMEKLLLSCKKTSNVLVVPLPPRYDLHPNSPVHHAIRKVNRYIYDLCCRNKRVDIINISAISRSHHTSHGMHLRNAGKRLLADLIVSKLRTAMVPLHPRRSQEPSVSIPTSLSAAGIHQHVTYAEAVRTNIDHRDLTPYPSNLNSCYTAKIPVDNTFLGEHIPATSPN